MAIGVYICLGGFVAFVLAIVIACDRMERMYYRKHPPDEWNDGTREVKFDENDHRG